MTVRGPDPLLAMMGGGGPTADYSLLATDKVRLVGDPVAVVVAESRYLAEDGCELVEVDYEELPPVVSAAAALDPAARRSSTTSAATSSARTSAASSATSTARSPRADRVAEFHLDVHRHQNVPMEGRGMRGELRRRLGHADGVRGNAGRARHPDGVSPPAWASTPEQVRVLAGDIGGSFGLKIGASREEVAVAAASRALGRPVKWIEDRSENLTASGQAREESFDVRAAVTDDGDMLGLEVEDGDRHRRVPGHGRRWSRRSSQAMLPGPYKIAALGFESTAVVTNKATYVAYRGPWAAETFVRERVIDLIAKELGLDPLEIRLRNVAPRTSPPAAR